MALVWTEEQGMLRDSARAFLTESAPIAHLRRLRDSADAQGYAPEVWRRFAELGFSATLVPEAHGGVGLGLVEAGVLAEELGRTLTPLPFLSTAVLAARALATAGSAAQQAAWLPRIAEGRAVIALAVDEASKHGPETIACTAARTATGWKLTGAKTLVLDGHVADAFIVVARSSEGPLLALVDAHTPGVTVERTVMLDAHNAARVHLADVAIAADAVLGAPGTGGALLETVLDAGRAVVAAMLLGVADEVFARTLAYLRERKQFERVIGSFQALQHRAAALYCDIELSRAMVLKSLQALDRGEARSASLVSAAKAHASTTATRAVQEGVQMHGGMGMTDAFDMGLFMKRARALVELFGDANFHADRFARLGGY